MFATRDFAQCRLDPEGKDVSFQVGLSGYSESLSSSTLQFTKRVHLYLDFDISPANRNSLVAEALGKGYYLSIRDREFARKRSEWEKPLAFISHDFRDKDALVRELAQEMVRLMCPVWYDEYSLKVGDSLRASIEKGLKEARKCIIVLSPNFLSNEGWSKAEFDSIFTREILEKTNVILPVWHNVGAKEIYDYSPRLADRSRPPIIARRQGTRRTIEWSGQKCRLIKRRSQNAPFRIDAINAIGIMSRTTRVVAFAEAFSE